MNKIGKRLLAIILGLTCLLMPGLAAEAAETYGEQLVTNGGFETLNASGRAEAYFTRKKMLLV